MRYSPKELNRKRGKKKATATKPQTSTELALFCSKDDYLMQPAIQQDPTGRISKKTIVYVCPNCGNTVNPQFDPTTHGMTVQTRDNAIEYRGKRRTIAKVGDRSHQDKKDDDLQKFINDPEPYYNNIYVHVTKRIIERKGAKHFKLAV